MPKQEPDSEPRAADLLPPDRAPEPPEIKQIAERRVAGWMTTHRLLTRNQRRPAGNSRRFWKKIEDDDPFLPAPPIRRMAQSTHELYPSDRLQRVETTRRPTPQPQQPRPSPKPKAVAKPAPKPNPQAVHTREPRRPLKPPPAATRDEAPPVDRRPPILPNPNLKKRPQGRISVGKSRRHPHSQPQTTAGPSAKEIRDAKIASREAGGPEAPPPLRGLDSVLGILGELRMAEMMREQGIEGDTNTDIADHRPPPRASRPPTP